MQTFDATYCCHSLQCKANCDKRLLPDTADKVPEYRGISMADFKTDNCGYVECVK